MRNKRLKKQRIIILMLCILIVILLISLMVLEKKKEEEETPKIVSYEEFTEEYQKSVIYPRNMTEMVDFEGDNETSKLYESLRVFVDYISYLKENVDSSKSKDFYEYKTDEIKQKLGITDESEFILLIEHISKNDVNAQEFKYAEIEPDTSYVEDRYFTFTVNLYYGEENNKVQFEVGFAEKINNRIPVKYRVVK